MPELDLANDARAESRAAAFHHAAPSISLPKGGGAIRGIGEKFAANPVTGTGSMTVPIATSPGRSGFGPQLALSYDSGAGNGAFGLGWSLQLPQITRKTDKGLPRYNDSEDSDIFILSGMEDLVPVSVKEGETWIREKLPRRKVGEIQYQIQRYRPRIEATFARIERWTNIADAADMFWRAISKDNVTTWYGKTPASRIADPENSSRIFSWLICETYDDKGNVITYDYKPEDSLEVDISLANERNRTDDGRSAHSRSANKYLKTIRYGNREPYFPVLQAEAPWPVVPGYRYTSKERNEETGFYYHGSRYYAPWLGRWTNADPAGLADGLNVYRYVHNNPSQLSDPTGMYGWKDFNKDTQRVNRYFGLINPGGAAIGAVTSVVTEKVTETITGKTLPQEDAPAKPLSGPERVEAATDALMVLSPTAPLNALTKAAGKSIGNAIKGKISKQKAVENVVKAEPTGIVAKTFETAEALDRAEVASNAGKTGDAARAYIDAGLSFIELVQAGTNLVLGARSARSSAKSGPKAGGTSPAAEPNVVAADTALVEEGSTKAGTAPTEAESLAPQNAEALQGQRIWIVGEEGASTTRAIRIKDNRVTYDTNAPAHPDLVAEDMGVIGNNLKLQDGVRGQGTWITGTHGTPAGEFGGSLSDPSFYARESRFGPAFGWQVEYAGEFTDASQLPSGGDKPVVYNWCYSSACVKP
ncbi:MAG TPA: SpvB/TcaC N-terminal domain-containing protein [Terrimicrobiaceae bacterium]